MKNAPDDCPSRLLENPAPTSEKSRQRFRWTYAVALAAACALGAVLFLPFQIEFTRRNADPEGTIAWDSSRFGFLITYKYDDTPGNTRYELWGPVDVIGSV